MKNLLLLILLIISINAQSKLDEARQLMLENRFKEAANLLQESLQQNISSDAYLKLGIGYNNLMKNNDALIALQKAIELDSNNVDILINLATTYSSLGLTEDALENYESVLSIDSLNVFAKLNYGRLLLDAGRTNEAEENYSSLLKSDSTNSFYYRQLGYIHQKRNEWEGTYKFYKRAYQINHRDIFTISNLAKVYFQKEMPDSAITLLDKGLKVFNNNTQLLKLKSDIYFSIKNYPGTVNAIVRLIANGDESAQLYQRLGICYYQISVENFIGEAKIVKLESAVDALLKASELDSTESLTELYLGMTFKELERNKEAIEHLQKAIDLIYPKFTSAIYTNLAIVYSREKNYPAAIQSFKSAMDFDQENPNYLYYLASTYDQYYYDKKVPLIYYQMYVACPDTLDPTLKKYAQERIEELKETVHFQNGNGNK